MTAPAKAAGSHVEDAAKHPGAFLKKNKLYVAGAAAVAVVALIAKRKASAKTGSAAPVIQPAAYNSTGTDQYNNLWGQLDQLSAQIAGLTAGTPSAAINPANAPTAPDTLPPSTIATLPANWPGGPAINHPVPAVDSSSPFAAVYDPFHPEAGGGTTWGPRMGTYLLPGTYTAKTGGIPVATTAGQKPYSIRPFTVNGVLEQ